MIEEWKIYKCKKDKNHPCVLEAGEIRGIWKGGISTVLHGKQKKPRVVINGCIRRIIKNV